MLCSVNSGQRETVYQRNPCFKCKNFIGPMTDDLVTPSKLEFPDPSGPAVTDFTE